MTVAYYGELLAQERRVEAFRRAIARTVRPGDRVLDLGTGLGTFAFFAADAGAGRVWGVDGSAIVTVARQVARRNGYDDRVAFVRGWLPGVQLAEPADVLIFEDFPARLLNDRVFRLLTAFHRRYAAPSVRAVPASAELHLGLVELPAGFAPSGLEAGTAYGIDWADCREYLANTPLQIGLPASALALPGARVGSVPFGRAPGLDRLRGEAAWTADRHCTVHGLAYWFDLDLGDGTVLSNAPGSEAGSWGHLFLPVDPPVSLRAGARVHAAVAPSRLADGAPGWLSWELTVATADGAPARRRGHEFSSLPASLEDLAGASPDAAPRRNALGDLTARALALADGSRTVREIASAIAPAVPGREPAEIERRVVQLLRGRVSVGNGPSTEVQA